MKLLPCMDYDFTADSVIVETGETDFVEARLYEVRSKKTCSMARIILC